MNHPTALETLAGALVRNKLDARGHVNVDPNNPPDHLIGLVARMRENAAAEADRILLYLAARGVFLSAPHPPPNPNPEPLPG